jgi:long-chain acyl-CoA synthetase
MSESRLRTICEAFARSVRLYSEKTALQYKDSSGKYRGITYGELDRLSGRLAGSLRELGVVQGDRVAIISYHGPEWVIADLAVIKLGAIVVPIYHTLTPSAMSYVLADAGCRLAFVENALMLASVDAVREDLPSLEHAVMFEDEGECRAGVTPVFISVTCWMRAFKTTGLRSNFRLYHRMISPRSYIRLARPGSPRA